MIYFYSYKIINNYKPFRAVYVIYISEQFCKTMPARFLPGVREEAEPGVLNLAGHRQGCAGPGTWPRHWPKDVCDMYVIT